METKLLKDILLTPWEGPMGDEATFPSHVSRNGQVPRIKPLRINGSAEGSTRPFEEAHAIWNAIEALEHVRNLAGKRMGFLRPSSEAVVNAAKEVLSYEFTAAPDPKRDAPESF